jgi:hypothetical protein
MKENTRRVILRIKRKDIKDRIKLTERELKDV